jgi:hypothetical protein
MPNLSEMSSIVTGERPSTSGQEEKDRKGLSKGFPHDGCGGGFRPDLLAHYLLATEGRLSRSYQDQWDPFFFFSSFLLPRSFFRFVSVHSAAESFNSSLSVFIPLFQPRDEISLKTWIYFRLIVVDW